MARNRKVRFFLKRAEHGVFMIWRTLRAIPLCGGGSFEDERAQLILGHIISLSLPQPLSFLFLLPSPFPFFSSLSPTSPFSVEFQENAAIWDSLVTWTF